jgi:hypothetical protein
MVRQGNNEVDNMTKWTIYNKDINKFFDDYDGPRFHAALMDVSYNLSILGKAWDNDIALQESFWRKMSRILLPGALTFTFMAPKYSGLLHLAQAQAGFTHGNSFYSYSSHSIQELPTEFLWCYATGKQVKTESHIPGFSYSCSKPQFESVVVAQNRIDSPTKKENVKKWGTGCINQNLGGEFMASDRKVGPGQLLLTHHPDCEPRMRKVKSNSTGRENASQGSIWYFYKRHPFRGKAVDGYENAVVFDCVHDCRVDEFCRARDLDKERASLYFAQFHWLYESMERIASEHPLIYIPKPDRYERNAGLGHLEDAEHRRLNSGGLSNDPRWASTTAKNAHPTLKPIHLAYFLASILKPHHSYGPLRLFNGFCGSGTEAIGGLLGGWDEIVMVDSNEEHCKVSDARMHFFNQHKEQFGNNARAIINQDYEKEEDEQQMRLF